MDYRDRIFENEQVLLDGGVFTGCTFRNCELAFKGLEGCRLVACRFYGCRWGFLGPARLAMQFLAALYQMPEGGRQLVENVFDEIRGGGETFQSP